METKLDILIIGASQAGLAMGYFLKQKKTSFAILGAENRVGGIWRSRYDSLMLFTPKWFSALPGMTLKGNPGDYATKDEIADYLEAYAASFDLPVQLNERVQSLEKNGKIFSATTKRGTYAAKKIIVATGPFQKAFIPPFAQQLPQEIYQIHTSSYSKPQQLQPGAVLVVGAGNSGAQIAVELYQTREVTLSVGKRLKFFPYEILGKSLFWWFDKIGLYHLTSDTKLGQWIRTKGDPIIGKELKKLIRTEKVKLKPRAKSIVGKAVTFEDGSRLEVQNIIWATGFFSDYSWVKIPNAIGENGIPIHRRGVSPIGGLFFLGLPWQHNRSSALIGGVGADAESLAKFMFAKL